MKERAQFIWQHWVVWAMEGNIGSVLVNLSSDTLAPIVIKFFLLFFEDLLMDPLIHFDLYV